MTTRRRHFTRPKQVRSPSLPNLYRSGSSQDLQYVLHKTCITLINELNGVSKIFAVALLSTGARPRELLDLTTSDIDARGMVIIRAVKGSEARIVLCPILLQLLPPVLPDQPVPLFRRYSYSKFYRACKGLYEHALTTSEPHRPLGRLFRRAFASGNLSLASGDVQLVAKTLGHKSTDSTLYYLKARSVGHG